MAVDLISFKMVDERGKTRAAVFPTPAGGTLVNLGTFVVTMAARLDALSGLAVTGAQVQLSLALPGGIKTSPVADHYTDRGGLFAFSVTGSEYRTSLYVPGVYETLINGDDIPVSFTEVADFVQACEVGPGVPVSDHHANAIDSFLGGRRVNRK